MAKGKVPETVFIGLGSNMSDPRAQVLQGINAIKNLALVSLKTCSSLYLSPPYGNIKQADFINAVVKVTTVLSPKALLDALLNIEVLQQRQRTIKWGPRTLDLDILFYGHQSINTEHLTIPHPEFHRRLFCLVPLLEISPDAKLPDGHTIKNLLPNKISPLKLKKVSTANNFFA